MSTSPLLNQNSMVWHLIGIVSMRRLSLWDDSNEWSFHRDKWRSIWVILENIKLHCILFKPFARQINCHLLNFSSASIFNVLQCGLKLVKMKMFWVSNSFDLDETSSYSRSKLFAYWTTVVLGVRLRVKHDCSATCKQLKVTQPLIKNQAVWHSDNIITNFKPHWSTLKI